MIARSVATVFLSLVVLSLILGCDPFEDSPIDTSAPADVSTLQAQPGDGQIQLAWTDPDDADFSHIVLSYTLGTGVNLYVGEGIGRIIIAGLSNHTSYRFTFHTVDLAGNQSSGRSVEAIPDGVADRSPPDTVAGLQGIPGDGYATLSWINPANEDFHQVQITHDQEGGSVPILLPASYSSVTLTGLINGLPYAFEIATSDDAGNASSTQSVTVTPEGVSDSDPPGDITLGPVVAGDGAVVLQWTDPADTDLNHIEITHDQTGGTDPIYVAAGAERAAIAGLTNGLTYIFTIVAVDTSGNGSPGVTVSGAPTSVYGGIAITIEVATPAGEIVDLTGNEPTLNKSLYEEMKVTTSVDAASYAWYLDGTPIGTDQNNVVIESQSLAVSVHELAMVLEKDGALYAAGVRFSVIEN